MGLNVMTNIIWNCFIGGISEVSAKPDKFRTSNLVFSVESLV